MTATSVAAWDPRVTVVPDVHGYEPRLIPFSQGVFVTAAVAVVAAGAGGRVRSDDRRGSGRRAVEGRQVVPIVAVGVGPAGPAGHLDLDVGATIPGPSLAANGPPPPGHLGARPGGEIHRAHAPGTTRARRAAGGAVTAVIRVRVEVDALTAAVGEAVVAVPGAAPDAASGLAHVADGAERVRDEVVVVVGARGGGPACDGEGQGDGDEEKSGDAAKRQLFHGDLPGEATWDRPRPESGPRRSPPSPAGCYPRPR